MKWNTVYTDFPINKDYIWLNNCGVSVMPAVALQATQNYLEALSRSGILQQEFPLSAIKKNIKEKICRLLQCQPDEFTIVHNTNEGMNFISYGLNLKKGDEILLVQNEYPSNVYPWVRWKEKKVDVKFIPHADNPQAFLESFLKMCSPHTKVLAVSAVDWITGMPYPLEETGKICAEKNILHIVDCAQGIGHVKLDVNTMNIDFLAFSAWKWLLGPLGLGGLFIRKNRLPNLEPHFMNTASVVQDEKYLPYKTELKPNADRYISSTANYTDWIHFSASLDYLAGIGQENVRERIFNISEYLQNTLRDIGFQLTNDLFPGHRTGIVSAFKEGVNLLHIQSELQKAGIVCALREGNLRFSPHIFINEEQISRTVKTIKILST